MPVLNSQAVADKYPLSSGAKGAIIANVWNSRGGWFSVTGATAWVQLQYGEQGQDHWVEEIFLGAGAFVVVPPNCRGLQFRNGVAGVVATVTAQIAQGDEPPLAISTIGQTNTVLVSSLNFQHNTLAVATEPTLDFEDSAGVLTFSPVDDPANTRVKLTVSFPNPVLIPGTLQIGNADTFLSRSSANTLDLGNSGTRGALRLFASATTDVELSVRVTADANPRFTIGGDGAHAWGPGSAATDVTLIRSAVGVLNLSAGTDLIVGTPTPATIGSGPGTQMHSTGTFSSSTTGTARAFSATQTGDATGFRWQMDTTGLMQWGPGNAAVDTNLYRKQTGWLASDNHLAVGGGNTIGTVQARNDQELWLASNSLLALGDSAAGAANPSIYLYRTAAGAQQGTATRIWMATSTRGIVFDVTTAQNTAYGSETFKTVAELDLSGNFQSWGTIGYVTGQAVGGSVTQLTSLSTGVTLNKITGRINTFSSALAANLNTVFTVTNSTVTAADTIIVNWANCITNNIPIWVSNITAGAFNIAYTNLGALTGAQSNAINFSVIKGANT